MNGFVSFYICYKHFYICHRGLWVMLAHFLTNPANERSLLRQLSHSSGFGPYNVAQSGRDADVVESSGVPWHSGHFNDTGLLCRLVGSCEPVVE